MSIVTIPREIQLLIFGQLRVLDLVRLSETCHRLKDAARDPSLWKLLTLTYQRIKNKNEACRNHVSRCSSLREIVITINGEKNLIRSDNIRAVVMKAKTTLTSIDLSSCFPNLSNAFFEKIGKMTQLTHLAVGGGNLRPGGISALACLTELTTLKVPGIEENTNISTALLADLFSKLKKLEQVEIKMDKCIPSYEVVKSLLNNNPNMHHLDITPSGLANRFHYMYHSTTFDLIADKCSQLTYIGIGHLWNVRNNITKMVERCPKLKHANFEDTNINDSTLALMSKHCPDLEYLNIAGCDDVTEEALERFANPATMANLRKLLVSKCYYSLELLKRLKQNLPKVEIVVIDNSEDSSDEDSSDEEFGWRSICDSDDSSSSYNGDE